MFLNTISAKQSTSTKGFTLQAAILYLQSKCLLDRLAINASLDTDSLD